MATFHSLEVEDIRQETPDCISVGFRLPPELQADFAFEAGQHLGIRCRVEGEELRRTYSLCSAPGSGRWRIAIKRVPGGRFSTFAHRSLQAGDRLDVMPPKGRFSLRTDPQRSRHLLAFAAGSGITPVMSMMRAVLQEEPRSRFTLFYGNRRVESIIFREAIEDLKNRYVDRLAVYHILSRQEGPGPLFSGRIDQGRAGELLDRLVDLKGVEDIFLCGPFAMMAGIRESLLERGVAEDQIHRELFAPAVEQEVRPPHPPGQRPEAGTIRIRLDGQTRVVPFASGERTILDLAQAAGVDLPYACKGGVCSTCRARLEEGKVDMPVNYALEADEREAGFILTCQSYPQSENLLLDFDV